MASIRITIAIVLPLSMCCGAGSDPPPPLSQLRFSPDGRYVLAQDAAAITILTVQPFKILFRIPAREAELVQFTPDSRQLVFLSSAMHVDAQKIAIQKSSARVEHWSLASEALVESVGLPPLPCSTKQLSPDGEALICVDFKSNLRLVDVASGAIRFEKKHFAWLFGDPTRVRPWGMLGLANIDFSPDGRFVVAQPVYADGDAIVINVPEARTVRLSGELKGVKRRWLAWMSSDRLLVGQYRKPKTHIAAGIANTSIVAFPSGHVIAPSKIPAGLASYRAATDPNHVLSIGRASTGRLRSEATDLNTGLTIISNTPALDVLGHFYVGEPNPGEVGLYEIGKGLQATVILPRN